MWTWIASRPVPTVAPARARMAGSRKPAGSVLRCLALRFEVGARRHCHAWSASSASGRGASHVRLQSFAAGRRRPVGLGVSRLQARLSPSAPSATTARGRSIPSALPWRAGVDALRARAQAEVPELVRRRVPAAARVGSARRPRCSASRSRAGSCASAARGGAASRAGLSRRLRRAFERLGPAYIKLGQIVSSGQGLFPPELVDEFKRCRDQVPAEPFAVVRRVVEEDLGAPLERRLRALRRAAIAAASIAQVHAARLPGGEEVVVKVQRPQVARLVRRDIEAMAWIAPLLVGRIPVAALANPPALVELFAETIVEELDFRLEAQNMLDIARLLREAGQTIIVVPRPHPELVTRRVLVMERLHGFKYEDVEGMRARRHRHRRAGARAADRVPRGRDDLRRLPRRLPRRQPARDAGRPRRALRLRHHRPHDRAAAARLPAHDDDRRGERHPRAARGVPRPRRAAARRRPRRAR